MHENMQLFYLHPKSTAKSEVLRRFANIQLLNTFTAKTIHFDSSTTKRGRKKIVICDYSQMTIKGEARREICIKRLSTL